jgi:hypothetical protein
MTEKNSGDYGTARLVGECRSCPHEIEILLPAAVTYDRQRVHVRCANCDTVTSIAI